MGKKVLVCSIPCWNSKIGSDTFSTLMEGYEVDNIANLYVREGVPNSPVCHNYFQISENAVIKSVLKRGLKTGKQILTDNTAEADNGSGDTAIAQRYKNAGSKRNWLLLYAREFLWKLGKWKTKELDSFLDEFKPDVVFFAMEGYIHFNRIAGYILKRTGATGIGYFWDDNFTYKQSKSLGHNIYRFFQRKSLKKLAKKCSHFFAITPKTKKEADEFFKIDCELLTKPINYEGVEFQPYAPNEPLKMLYTGKLIIGRYDTVKLIGKALDEINKDGVKIELDIYTTTRVEENDGLSQYVHILGAIPQTEVAGVQAKADVLLFAEAIEGENAKTARLSFSTKLTDYFRSGKCIFAVGNGDVAPIEYLKEEDAALTASSYEEILEALNIMVRNNGVVAEYAKKAFDCGKKNHDKAQIQARLFSKFE
ncbi:MAG: glycosyltransferase family 4 protein [Ruminococcaceae bacterium]|nr:glycosyltransferase family 4 protein [Oscillospiraceae bacterium]